MWSHANLTIILWDILSEGQTVCEFPHWPCRNKRAKQVVSYLYQYWVTGVILMSRIKNPSPHLKWTRNKRTKSKLVLNNVESKSCKRRHFMCTHVCVCVCVCLLSACASPGLCQIRTVVCRTVILSNGLSLPADVLFSAPQLHPTCFHAVRQCSYILFLCMEL